MQISLSDVFVLCSVIPGVYCMPETGYGFWRPDFESDWLSLVAQNRSQSVLTVPHGLGEVPILVDVQVKAADNIYGDIVYPAVGVFPRDDDQPVNFGSVVYLYNSVNVLVIAPIDRNGFRLAGAAIYTGEGVYHTGPHQQQTYNTLVRVRAWRPNSLPEPDFSATDIEVVARSSDVDKLYIERNHSLGEYPALVRVRTKLQVSEEWMSDAVGSSLVVSVQGHPNVNTRFVVYGFNTEAVRTWIPNDGNIFTSEDTSAHIVKSTSGRLEIFAWKPRSVMRPKFTHRFPIGPSVGSEQLQQSVAPDMTTSTSYVSVWAECLSGKNKGFRFPGSGSLSYDDVIRDSKCTYGGLTYGFTTDSIKLWRPTDASNGGVICIADVMGSGINSQLALNAEVVVHWWDANLLERAENHTGTVMETCTNN